MGSVYSPSLAEATVYGYTFLLTTPCMDNIFIERLWRSLKYEAVYLYEFAGGLINNWNTP